MQFYMPTKVYSESNCVEAHSDEITSLGTHALIVTGRSSSKKNGSLDDVTKVLEEQGVKYTIFNEVEENPSVETIMKARDLGLVSGADFVIGIGGGSPLDASKAIALMMNYPMEDWQFLYEKSDAKALPIVAVPTTCGTGSEVTGIAVLTRHDLKTKASMIHKIFPDIALIDGKYILNTPQNIIINTSIDALSHLIESGINTLADEYSEMTVRAGLNLWKECRPCIEGKEELTIDFAQKLMKASTFAGMSIAQTGTAIPHALSYALTYYGGIPHGAAVGLFQANYLEGAHEDRRNAILEAGGFSDLDDLRQMIKTLVPVQVEQNLLEQSAKSVLNNEARLKKCPYPIDDTVMKRIISI